MRCTPDETRRRRAPTRDGRGVGADHRRRAWRSASLFEDQRRERLRFLLLYRRVGATAEHQPGKGRVHLRSQQAREIMRRLRAAAVAQQHVGDLVRDDVRLVPGSGALLVENMVRPACGDPHATWDSRPRGEGVQEDHALALEYELGHELAEVERSGDVKLSDDRGEPSPCAPGKHSLPRILRRVAGRVPFLGPSPGGLDGGAVSYCKY